MLTRLNTVMSKLEVDTDHMQLNLHLTEGAIAAEPLYLLLEKYGHTAAHEASKSIAHAALEAHISLFEAADQDTTIASYWRQLTAQEREYIKNPESAYTGLAATKAMMIHDYWQSKVEV
jgi:adenylosuccinate lyase